MPRKASAPKGAASSAVAPPNLVAQPEAEPTAVHLQTPAPVDERYIDSTSLAPLIVEAADAHDLYFDSLLDVGCGGRPLANWFSRYPRAEAPRRYVCIEPHAPSLEAARTAGHIGLPGFSAPFDFKSDLVVAADVLEYVPPQRAARFLASCASACTKVFALSTLNARTWSRAGSKKEFAHIKWVPTTALQCFRQEGDVGRILHVLDSDGVRALMTEAFDADLWDVRVFEGAPWELRDLSADRTDRLYTKTFALAVRRS